MTVLEREKLETKRELRYGLMRLARAFGQAVFYFGLFLVFLGILGAILILPNMLQWMFGGGLGSKADMLWPNHPYLQFLVGAVVLALGFGCVSIGPAMYIPYIRNSEMPSSYIRVCHSCGKPLRKAWIIHRCQECGKWFPLGIDGYLVRLLSKSVTIINWTIALAGVFFFLR